MHQTSLASLLPPIKVTFVGGRHLHPNWNFVPDYNVWLNKKGRNKGKNHAEHEP